ncbi:MAG: hypothetical protein SF069_17150 [Phycisphaerae bacterium]|nr:hypothetical protein [Phycisphaerae bacterium]
MRCTRSWNWLLSADQTDPGPIEHHCYCTLCGYDLLGLQHRCPECGHIIGPWDRSNQIGLTRSEAATIWRITAYLVAPGAALVFGWASAAGSVFWAVTTTAWTLMGPTAFALADLPQLRFPAGWAQLSAGLLIYVLFLILAQRLTQRQTLLLALLTRVAMLAMWMFAGVVLSVLLRAREC